MKSRRRRYIIKPGIQFRYVGVMFIAVLAVAVICISTTYYSSIAILGESLPHSYPQGRLLTSLREINLVIIYRALLLVPFIALLGILESHRITGPAHRIERILREIGKGNLDVHVELRKYDELKGIANAINDMVSGLKKSVKDKT